MAYHLLLLTKLMRKDIEPLKPFEEQGTSVVICGKNEANNFKKNLPKILAQDYKDFEVIVVDDHSSDSTPEVLKDIAKEDSKLKIVTSNSFEDKPGKKTALSAGIGAAKNNWIVVTDADCWPASEHWIKHMVEPLSKEKKLSIGISPYKKEPGFINKMIQYETNLTATQYASYTLAGMPYMAVGRNMAYKKVFFTDNEKNLKGQNLASGDDDLLVNQFADPNSTQIVLHPDSFTYSPAHTSLKGWLKQKSRHQTAGSFYKLNHKILLSLFMVSMMLFYWLMLILFFSKFFYGVIATMLVLGLVNATIFYKCTKKINPKGHKVDLGFFYSLWFPIIFIRSLFIRKTQWN